MKRVFSIFLLLLISTQLLIRIGIYISWKANQDVLAKTECINRNNKNSCCKAKCQLTKRLSELDNASDQQNQNKQTHKIEISDIEPFVIVEASTKCFASLFFIDERSYKNLTNFYSFEWSRFSFHPPASNV